MGTYKELVEQRRELEQRIEAARKAEIAAVVAAIRQKVTDYNLGPADIFKSGGTKSVTKPVAPKYRGANGETWTGRGRTPSWVTAAIAEGSHITDLLITNEQAPAQEAA